MRELRHPMRGSASWAYGEFRFAKFNQGAQLKRRVPLAWSCRTFLESPHILSEVGNAGFRSFRLVPVHGLQKGRPNRHVTALRAKPAWRAAPSSSERRGQDPGRRCHGTRRNIAHTFPARNRDSYEWRNSRKRPDSLRHPQTAQHGSRRMPSRLTRQAEPLSCRGPLLTCSFLYP